MSHRFEEGQANLFVMECDTCGATHREPVHKSSTDLDIHSALLSARLYWHYNWGQGKHTCPECLGRHIMKGIQGV